MASSLLSGASGPDPAPTPSTASPWAPAARSAACQTHTHSPACPPPAVLSPGCFLAATWHLTDRLLSAQDGVCPRCSRGLFLEMRHLLLSSICDVQALYGSGSFPESPHLLGASISQDPHLPVPLPARTPYFPGPPTSQDPLPPRAPTSQDPSPPLRTPSPLPPPTCQEPLTSWESPTCQVNS